MGEPVRALNLLLQRQGLTLSFREMLDDASLGLWHVQASAGGLSARGTGQGKREAKRAACAELLHLFTELSGVASEGGPATM